MRCILWGFILGWCILNQTWAEKRPPVLSDIFRIQKIAAPALSPDGKSVVYTVSQLLKEKNKESTNLWLLTLANKKSKQITFTDDSNSIPKWSPNGRWIAYLSDETEHKQIWLYSVKTGNRKQLTHFNEDISDFSWSPDSKELAFIGTTLNESDPDDPIVINRYNFKDDKEGYLTTSRHHLFLFNIKTMILTQLTDGEHDEYSPSWSPNGSYLAYVSKRGKDPDRNYSYQIFLIQTKLANSERQVTHYRGSDMAPDLDSSISWSPDSSKLAYLRTQEGKWYYYAPSQLSVVDLNNGRESLLAPIDRWFFKPQWSADGKNIYALVEQNRNTYLNQINVNTGRLRQLTYGKHSDENYSLQQNKIVLLSTDDQHPSELFLLDKKLIPLTQHNKALLNEVAFQAAEDFSFSNSDGIKIDGLLIKPQHFVKKKSPSIVYLHGGPVDQYSHAFDFELQWFAANGYLVIAPNPRGSSGKGLDFSKAIYADWGNRDVKDVLETTDYLNTQGLVDLNSLAIGGWSYGGILTNYVIARDNRFKVAFSAACGPLFFEYGPAMKAMTAKILKLFIKFFKNSLKK